MVGRQAAFTFYYFCLFFLLSSLSLSGRPFMRFGFLPLGALLLLLLLLFPLCMVSLCSFTARLGFRLIPWLAGVGEGLTTGWRDGWMPRDRGGLGHLSLLPFRALYPASSMPFSNDVVPNKAVESPTVVWGVWSVWG